MVESIKDARSKNRVSEDLENGELAGSFADSNRAQRTSLLCVKVSLLLEMKRTYVHSGRGHCEERSECMMEKIDNK